MISTPIRICLFPHLARASFSCLDPSCTLPPLLPFPLSLSIYIQQPHTDIHFFRFYWKAWANKKVFSCDLNWDTVGTFLRVAGREFQRDGAMKLKERCPNDLRFHFGIFSSFSLEDRREWDRLNSLQCDCERVLFFHIIFYVSCFGSTVLYICLECHIFLI